MPYFLTALPSHPSLRSHSLPPAVALFTPAALPHHLFVYPHHSHITLRLSQQPHPSALTSPSPVTLYLHPTHKNFHPSTSYTLGPASQYRHSPPLPLLHFLTGHSTSLVLSLFSFPFKIVLKSQSPLPLVSIFFLHSCHVTLTRHQASRPPSPSLTLSLTGDITGDRP